MTNETETVEVENNGETINAPKTIDYNGSETHNSSIRGEVTRHYYDCPGCGFPLCEWTDCPECGWYDEDAWERTPKPDTDN